MQMVMLYRFWNTMMVNNITYDAAAQESTGFLSLIIPLTETRNVLYYRCKVQFNGWTNRYSLNILNKDLYVNNYVENVL